MKHITRSAKHILLLLLFATGAGMLRTSAQTVVINSGAPGPALYAVGPIYVSSTMFYRYSRFAYLYTSDELAAAGIQPGAVITALGWRKSSGSSAAGPAVFDLFMKNSTTAAYSTATELWDNLSAGTTEVYHNTAQAIPTTAAPNFINFTLSTPFTYTGGSLEILAQWDISAAAAPIATGSFEWENTTVADRIYGMGGTSLPSSLSSVLNNVNIDNMRPVIQITLNGSTGIQPASAAPLLTLYPNPADQFIELRNYGGAALERIEVMDLLGKVVYAQGRMAGTDLRIDVSAFGPGAYFLRAFTANGPTVKRFTVR
ncbi:MAG: T9SS type A sorting domain-containing protein [Bacteroidetes bacterium]|nr:T9SS type A sorting domain-containing protein [Bacteroidota bacterium]MBS1942860.1 T9SS type A sorting domain-containing protein [Bacteroidota bacterium]